MGFGIKRKFRKIVRASKVARESIRKEPNLERSTLLLCHALEKGMGMPTVKVGFGKEKAADLIINIKLLISNGKKDSYAVQESLAILKSYCDFQKHGNIDLGNIQSEAYELYSNYHNSCTGGYRVLSKEDEFSIGQNIDYASFVYSRHSMRTYSNNPVSKEELFNVIELAKRAPSACNRQPWKIYTSEKKSVNNSIMRAVPQQPFLEGIPYFGVVTVDKNMFSDDEIYQWYINGGLFLAYLGLAFHHFGIGSCIFQFPVFFKNDTSLRENIDIPQNEAIIAIIGYGKYPENAKCIIAERRPCDDILIFR